MNSQKAQRNVTPAQVGVQNLLKALDWGLRRNDRNRQIQTFCEIIKFKHICGESTLVKVSGWQCNELESIALTGIKRVLKQRIPRPAGYLTVVRTLSRTATLRGKIEEA